MVEGSMKPLPHDYDVDLIGGPQGYATISAAGLPDLTTAPPREYDGPGDAWSPEHLLLASVSSCFLFTFRAVARTLRAEFRDVGAQTSGIVSRVGGVTRFTDVVIRATVTAAAGASVELLQRAIDKTTAHCLVSSSLATPVRVEAVIHTAGWSGSVEERFKRTA
jgi:organic hydroperoxide reductase OsmC/OhrA